MVTHSVPYHDFRNQLLTYWSASTGQLSLSSTLLSHFQLLGKCNTNFAFVKALAHSVDLHHFKDVNVAFLSETVCLAAENILWGSEDSTANNRGFLELAIDNAWSS